MASAITEETTVQEGGKVTIENPSLPKGARVRVVITVTDDVAADPPPLTSLVGRSKPSFRSAREIDEFIRRERDAWG